MSLKKLAEDELEAASWYFAYSNLGCDTDRLDPKLKRATSWKEVSVEVRYALQDLAEDDEMMDGFYAEKESWVKSFRGKVTKVILEMWDQDKKRIGLNL